MSNTIIANKYEIISSIGEGTFGKVFKGRNIRTDQAIAIKIQHKNIANVLKHEAKIYKILQDVSGIPIIRNYGTDNGYNYLILDLLDISLDIKVLKPKETIKYILEAITIIEHIHNKGVIHRDIKPDNFLLRDINGINILYLIDFGLSKYYLNPDKTHMAERKERKLIGTAKYSSLNIHLGIEASRRDDLESLCLSFISIYQESNVTNILPWSQIIDDYHKQPSDVKIPVLDLYAQIKNIKEKSLEWMNNFPGEFITMILYCRKLRFDEKPNYNYLRGLFQNLLIYNV